MKRWTMLVMAVGMLVMAGQAFAAKADKAKGEKVAGEITKIDGANITIVPHVKKGEAPAEAVVVVTNDATAVTVNGEQKTVSNLAVAQKVKVTLGMDGKTAVAITVGSKKVAAPSAPPAADAPSTQPAK